MYIEILIIAIIVFGLLILNTRIDTTRLYKENQGLFDLLKEKDYEFLLRAKYGDNVIDPDAVFRKRVFKGLAVSLVIIFIFITKLSLIYIIIALVVGYLVFKSQYIDLKKFYKKHLNTIDSLLPYYLKSLEVLVQHYTVPVALARSIDDAPEVFKSGLKELVAKIDAGDSSIEPYMDFARQYPVRDSMRMMRLLYRLGLGSQERKQEQLLAFSKTISNLQNKSRETKYKERLEKMEKKTMTMLTATGAGVMVILVLAIFQMFVSA